MKLIGAEDDYDKGVVKSQIKYVWVCGHIDKSEEFIFNCVYRTEKSAKLWLCNHRWFGHHACAVEKCHRGVYFMAEIKIKRVADTKRFTMCSNCGQVMGTEKKYKPKGRKEDE